MQSVFPLKHSLIWEATIQANHNSDIRKMLCYIKWVHDKIGLFTLCHSPCVTAWFLIKNHTFLVAWEFEFRPTDHNRIKYKKIINIKNRKYTPQQHETDEWFWGDKDGPCLKQLPPICSKRHRFMGRSGIAWGRSWSRIYLCTWALNSRRRPYWWWIHSLISSRGEKIVRKSKVCIKNFSGEAPKYL